MANAAAFVANFATRGMGRAFRHRDFTLFALSGWIANMGMWLQRIGVQWLTWEITGSYGWLGAMAFAEAMGIMSFLPISGILADRGNQLFLSRIAQFLMMALSLGLALLTLVELIDVWVLLIFMTLHGMLEGFWTPLRMSITPNLVPREDMSSAIGIGSLFFNLAQLLGPAAAGILITVFADRQIGIGVLFLITTVSFFGYLAALFVIRLRQDETRAGPHGSFFSDFREGIIYVAAMRGLAWFMALMLMTTVIMRAFRELLAGYADGRFQAGPEGLAMLTSAIGVGAVLGSFFIANFKSPAGMTRLVFASFAMAIVMQTGFALAPTFWFALICTAGLGITIAIGGVGSQILVQSAIHGEMRGRVMSLWSIIVRVGPALGAWTIGAITDLWNFQMVMIVATAAYLIFYLAMLPKAPLIATTLETTPSKLTRN
ncbi:MAG: MFS transporter [Pseudomonadota bacterium]|nr:MFS transporter [Pseudomonadota bacterium]